MEKEGDMSVQLKELLDRIKQEGVKEAETEAARIKNEAQGEAARIIEQARKEADAAIEKSRSDIRQFEAAGKEAIRQAGRDLILSVKAELTALFESILHRQIGGSLDPQTLKNVIGKLLESWAGEPDRGVDVMLSEHDWQNVESSIMDQMSAELKKGVDIRPSAQIDAGFRISEKDGSAFFDFTDRGLTEFLMEYLNPRVSELLKGTQD